MDTLYRDFLFSETLSLNEYLVKGTISLYVSNKQLINLYTTDPCLKCFSIRSNLPIEDEKNFDNLLYSVLTNENLNESIELNKIFDEGFKIIAKISNSYNVPMYKKTHYSQFPNVVIDENRFRIFYLKSYEWLISSHESNFISARNIAILISRLELADNFKPNININKHETSFQLIIHFILFNFTGFLFHFFINKLTSFLDILKNK